MNGRHILPIACAGAFAAFAGSALAQETTITEQHREIRAPEPAPPPAPPPAVVVHHSSTTTFHTGAAPQRRVVVAHRVRRAPTHVVVARTAPAVRVTERTTAVAQAPAPPPSAPVATIDRKTVIHRDENGDVSRRTRIERQDADGTTTVIHRSTEVPADAGPPPRAD